MKPGDAWLVFAAGIAALVLALYIVGPEAGPRLWPMLATALQAAALGFAAVAVGHYFAKRLEEHKATIAWARAVAEQRVENCLRLLTAVWDHYAHVGSLGLDAARLHALRAAGQELSPDDWRVLNRYLEEESMRLSSIVALAPLTFPTVRDAAATYHDAARQVCEAAVGGALQPERAVAALMAAAGKVGQACNAALESNPFTSATTP